MTDLIKITPSGDGISYSVKAYNGVDIGSFYREVDGYYVYAPILRAGFWPAHMLRAVADKLDELNAPWDKEIQDYFNA